MNKNLKALILILALNSPGFNNIPEAKAEVKGKPSAKNKVTEPDKIKIPDIKINSKEDINKVFELGAKAYESQKYEDAIEVFKKIIEKFPGYGDAYYYIGLSYYGLGKYYLSIAYFLEANKIFGKTKLDALFGAGLAYLSSGYTDEARATFQKVARESRDNELVEDAKTWINSIDEQVLQKEKIELLTTDINFRQGIEYLDNQNYVNAERNFHKSLADKPNSLLSLYYLGNTLYLREKYKEAIETFEKIILIDPDSKIASDARLYIRVIEEINATLPNIRPYYFQSTLGTIYDSNLSYADSHDTIISDMAGTANLLAGYIFNNNFQAQYNYYGNIFSGINDKTPGLNIHSYDFNLQRHTTNAKFNYSILNNLLGEIDYNFNWYLLGGSSFLFNNHLSPKLNYYISPNLITVLQYNFDLNAYPAIKTRNNIEHSFELSQYFYLLNNRLWFRAGYNFQKINADDTLLSQSGLLNDGGKYNLEYNFTNSLVSNDLLFDTGLNLLFNSRLRLNAKISFNNYDKPDIYRLTSPITNIATGKTEIKVIRNVEKVRQDILYNLGLGFSIPIYNNLSASLSYNFLYNHSNITNNDYIGRSYIKHLFGLNLTYEF